MIFPVLIGIAAGLLFGAAVTALLLRMRQEKQRADALQRITRLETELAAKTAELARQAETEAGLKTEFESIFKALAADTLQKNSESFLTLANATLARQQTEAAGTLEQKRQAVETLVKPLNESLERVNKEIAQLEKERAGTMGALKQQLETLDADQKLLRTETANLVKALRKPEVRGRWGEIQLQRVVEMAGMIDHVDFLQQETADTDDGQLRPDMIIKLPGGQNVVVDSKCPLDAYLEAVEAGDEAGRQAHLRNHARQVKDHIAKLSRKSYWRQFEPTPEFVVLFLPGEHFFSAALAQDPALIETGVDQSVIMATPTTLIALLKAVAYGWKQETIAASAKQISELGKDLYNRVRVFTSHFTEVGQRLNKATDAYDKAVGSLETRVLVQARRFPGLGAGDGKEIPIAEQLQKRTRRLQAPESADAAPETD